MKGGAKGKKKVEVEEKPKFNWDELIVPNLSDFGYNFDCTGMSYRALSIIVRFHFEERASRVNEAGIETREAFGESPHQFASLQVPHSVELVRELAS